MRVLVTGSRSWDDPNRIRAALVVAWSQDEDWSQDDLAPSPRPTLVSGACPIGADAIAEDFARICHWPIERHPAEWDKHGKRAGFVRNAEMVALGADVCLAFIKDGSKGATMTADLAEKAGIRTRRFTA